MQIMNTSRLRGYALHARMQFRLFQIMLLIIYFGFWWKSSLFFTGIRGWQTTQKKKTHTRFIVGTTRVKMVYIEKQITLNVIW